MAAKKSAKKKTRIEKKEDIVKKLLNNRRNKRYFIGGLILIVILAFAYFGKSLFIAAVVNGRPIFRHTLIGELEKQGGQQTLDALVTRQLIYQEAQKQGVVITSEEVEKEIQALSSQIESQGNTLDAALSLQGQTRETLEENIKIQKTVESLLKDETQLSEEELTKYFEENKGLYEEGAKFEELKENIRTQLQQEKLAEEFKNWMEKLKSESQIIYFVNF